MVASEVLAVMAKAAVNIWVRLSCGHDFSAPGVETARSVTATLCFYVWKDLSWKVAAPCRVASPPASAESSCCAARLRSPAVGDPGDAGLAAVSHCASVRSSLWVVSLLACVSLRLYIFSTCLPHPSPISKASLTFYLFKVKIVALCTKWKDFEHGSPPTHTPEPLPRGLGICAVR